jgi:hypothetical protein
VNVFLFSDRVGDRVGRRVGLDGVGSVEGMKLGLEVVLREGTKLGAPDSLLVGESVGEFVGSPDDMLVGGSVGDLVLRIVDGLVLGASVGEFVGEFDGLLVGDSVGDSVGDCLLSGASVGKVLCTVVGLVLGASVGLIDGSFVGLAGIQISAKASTIQVKTRLLLEHNYYNCITCRTMSLLDRQNHGKLTTFSR